MALATTGINFKSDDEVRPLLVEQLFGIKTQTTSCGCRSEALTMIDKSGQAIDH
jgi:hypothetical protein